MKSIMIKYVATLEKKQLNRKNVAYILHDRQNENELRWQSASKSLLVTDQK